MVSRSMLSSESGPRSSSEEDERERAPGNALRLPSSTGRRSVRRIRQHLNPLAAKSIQPAELPEKWLEVAFADPTLPLTIDVGCALGGWCVDSAEADASRNFLGLEIRPAAVEAALGRLARSGVKNAAFIQCNANVDIGRIVGDVHAARVPLERICVQFPDPHFKKKHQKRRVVTPAFADAVSKAVRDSIHEDPTLYVVSDVLDVATQMRDQLRQDPQLEECQDVDEEGWLRESPLSVPTEREAAVLAGLGATSTEPGKAFRALFRPL